MWAGGIARRLGSHPCKGMLHSAYNTEEGVVFAIGCGLWLSLYCRRTLLAAFSFALKIMKNFPTLLIFKVSAPEQSYCSTQSALQKPTEAVSGGASNTARSWNTKPSSSSKHPASIWILLWSGKQCIKIYSSGGNIFILCLNSWHLIIITAEACLLDTWICTQRWTIQRTSELQILQWKACCHCELRLDLLCFAVTFSM